MTDPLVSIESKDRIVGLDDRGCLVSFQAPSLPHEWAVPHIEPRLSWNIYLDNQATRASWQFHQYKMIEEGITFEGEIDGAIVEITVTLDHFGPNWLVKLTNRNENQTITRLDFRLEGPYCLGEAAQCTIPYCAGWSMPLAALEDRDSYNMAYPVKAAMQWVDLYTPEKGIYFGVHDPQPFYKRLQICRQSGIESVQWHFLDLDLQSGQSLNLPKIYLVAHEGDWHAGADIYKTWAAACVQPPEVPGWYRDKPAWAWVGLRGQYEETLMHDTAELIDVSDQVAECGIDIIQLTAFTERGHDTLYPDYRPGPSMGGDAGLQRAVELVHAAGRRFTIYTNGRCVDPDSSVDPNLRAAWAVRPIPGPKPAQETYGKVTFDIMCPGAPGWRELFTRRLTDLVELFDVDGIYIDQVSAATSLPCYQVGHDHVKPNLAWSNYRGMMADLRLKLKALKPSLILATEGVNDLLGQYFDSQQAHQDWPPPMGNKAQPLDTLFRYTFPDLLLNSGCVTHDEGGWNYLKVAHLAGSGFDFGVADWSTCSQAFCQAARFAVEWRSGRFGNMLGGCFESAPFPIEIDQYGIRANLFSGKPNNSALAVNVAWLPEESGIGHPDKISLKIPLPEGCRVQHITGESPDGRLSLAWNITRGLLNIDMQFSQLAGIIIQCQ